MKRVSIIVLCVLALCAVAVAYLKLSEGPHYACKYGTAAARSAGEWYACQAKIRAEERQEDSPAGRKAAAQRKAERQVKLAATESKVRAMEEAVNKAPAEMVEAHKESEERHEREEEVRGSREYGESQGR